MQYTVARQTTTVKIETGLVVRLRVIALRDGMVLGRLLERLIEAGMKAENLK